MYLTLKQLQYFVEIIDAGNMTRAAERLHLVPTALSLQVRAMERNFGVKLLQRHSRGVCPTEMGVKLYENGQKIMAMVHEAEHAITPKPAALPVIRLGMAPSIARLVGVDVVFGELTEIDGHTLQFYEGFSSDLEAKLANEELDLILCCGLKPSGSIQMLDLIEEQLVFVTSSDGAFKGAKVTLADALKSNLVLYGEKGACWNIVHSAARAAALPVNVVHNMGSVDVIRQMVIRGLATAIVPFGIIKEESCRGEIAVHAIEDEKLVRKIGLAYRAGDLDREVFCRFLNAIVKTLVASYSEAGPFYRTIFRGSELIASEQ